MATESRFTKYDLLDSVEAGRREIRTDVENLSADDVLATPVADLVDLIYEERKIAPIVLDVRAMTSSGAKDVSLRLPNQFDRGSFSVPGTRVTFTIPFTGEAILFDHRGQQYSHRAIYFRNNHRELMIDVEGQAPLDVEAVVSKRDEEIAVIQQKLDWLRPTIDAWNRELQTKLGELIETRRSKVLLDRQFDAALNVPIVARPGRRDTFSVDPKRRPMPPIQVSSSKGFSPEPAISDEGHEAILQEIDSFSTVVQRTPLTYADMPEESLRDIILAILNNRFGPASGETFSRHGKTDIFIPWHTDQGAVFIAECKIWKGPKAMSDGIDQLLGYLTWRDSKAALIVFAKRGQPTEIGGKAASVIEGHIAYKRARTVHGRTIYSLANPSDDAREIHLALIVVPITSP